MPRTRTASFWKFSSSFARRAESASLAPLISASSASIFARRSLDSTVCLKASSAAAASANSALAFISRAWTASPSKAST